MLQPFFEGKLFFARYVIRGDDEEWNEVLTKAGEKASVVSLKRSVQWPAFLKGYDPSRPLETIKIMTNLTTG